MPDRCDSEAARPLPIGVLFLIFLRLGSTAFGGLGASLGLLDAQLVQKYRLLQPGDIVEALAAVKLVPGSTLAQIVSFLGYRLRGWLGSAVALTAFLLPSTQAMLVLAVLRETSWFVPILARVSHGLSAAVVGLLVASIIRFARTSLETPVAWLGALLAFAAGTLLPIHASLIVVVAGTLGVLLRRLGCLGERKGQGARK
jgi:chromate transporter